MLIICEGLDASGKTTLANYLRDDIGDAILIRKKFKDLQDVDLQELIKYEWIVLLSEVVKDNINTIFIADRSYLTSLTFQKLYAQNLQDNSGYFDRPRENYEFDREHQKAKLFAHQYLSDLAKEHNTFIIYLESDVYELDNTLKTIDEKLRYKEMLEKELDDLQKFYGIKVLKYNTSEIPFTSMIKDLNKQFMEL